jgi:hypothetical protein
MDPATTEDGAPAAKRARIESDLGWAASFGKKQDPSASGASGGWTLRNWTEEKQAEQPIKPANEEEDWSFFQQGDSAASTSSTTSSSSSTSSASSSFKVPQGRAKRVSFAEEVKVVTIPKASAKDEEGEAELEEIADFGDEPEEDGASGGDAPLRLASSDAGAESLIDYLLSAVPQGHNKTKNAKYFVAKAEAGEGKENEQPRPPKAPKKQLDDLDEDSFLEAFIDDGTASSPQSIPIEETEAAKEKKAKKKPTFKF